MLAQLTEIALGQAQRNIMSSSMGEYLGRMRTITRLLKDNEELRVLTLELDENGDPMSHVGKAKGVFRMKLPMRVEHARLLFALISVDESLARRGRRRKTPQEVVVVDEDNAVDNINNDVVAIDPTNPASDKVTVSTQTFRNYKSALKWWCPFHCPEWEKVGVPWPDEIDQALKPTVASYKRDVASKKRRGIMKQKEGKSGYSFNGYIEISRMFARMQPEGKKWTWDEGIFGGLFTVLSVNTIGRSDNIDDCLVNNIGWINDAMTILFSTTKSDLTGDRTSEIKRLYANPFKPEICVVLKLAVYTTCTRRTRPDHVKTMRLFEGGNQNKRYYNILTEVIERISEESLGCCKEDIGTHSNRKFAESTAASRIDGPSRTQVCLRAGQSVGKTQDCYMTSEEDGDALVGRTVAQLKFTADEFDVLPLHFDSNTLESIRRLGWSRVIPDYDIYPDRFATEVIPKLVASLVYHYGNGDLRRIYPDGHPIFSQRIFTDQSVYEIVRGKAILTFAHCDESNMYATGVPAVISISREIRTFNNCYNNTKDTLQQRICEVEDVISTVVKDQPQKIVEILLERFHIDGIVPVTRGDIQSCITEVLGMQDGPFAQLMEKVDTMLNNRHSNRLLDSPGEESQLGDRRSGSNSGCKMYMWGGMWHIVPEGFMFPSFNVATMWNLWYFGDEANEVGSFKSITPCYDLTRAACRVNYSKCKSVMKKMVDIALEDEIISSERVTKENEQTVFNHSYVKLLSRIYPMYPKRPGSININTVANRLRRYNS